MTVSETDKEILSTLRNITKNKLMEEAVKLIKILDRFKTQDLRLKTH